MDRMAMEGPEIVVISSEAGRVEALSPMTMALPVGMVPMKTGKRRGRESASRPNQEAMMPAAWRALGEGWVRNAMGMTGWRLTLGSKKGAGRSLRLSRSGMSVPANSMVELLSI